MVVSAPLVMDKANLIEFFEKTFLMANVSPKIVLGMSFFTLSSADVEYLGRNLRWRTYITKETLPTT